LEGIALKMTGLGEVNQVKVVKEVEQGGSLMDQGFFSICM